MSANAKCTNKHIDDEFNDNIFQFPKSNEDIEEFKTNFIFTDGESNSVKEEKVKVKKEKVIKSIDYERILIKSLIAKEKIYYKLDNLENTAKNYIKKRTNYILKIKRLDDIINEVQLASGIYIDKLDNRSKLGRYYNTIKNFLKRGWKKISKFFRNNKEFIVGLCAIIIPVIGKFFFGDSIPKKVLQPAVVAI